MQDVCKHMCSRTKGLKKLLLYITHESGRPGEQVLRGRSKPTPMHPTTRVQLVVLLSGMPPMLPLIELNDGRAKAVVIFSRFSPSCLVLG